MAIAVPAWLSALLEPRFAFRIHMVQLAFITTAIILSITRAALPNVVTTRSNTLAITMGIKSIIVILYEVITTHSAKYRKWASLKAYAILNCAEIAFWFVVVIITFMGVSATCQGGGCAISLVVAFLAMILTFFAVVVAVSSVKEYRLHKKLARVEGGV